jgi:fucokinase
MSFAPWDYLILTASHAAQAEAYARQLQLREKLGLLRGFRQRVVVPDPGGRRVGSGGSTLCCLMEILRRELAGRGELLGDAQAWFDVLRRLRVLIIHAGGDSRRLPAYAPCGKIFVPLPGNSDTALGATLFDRQLPIYEALPPPVEGREDQGQIVITAGDVLLRFSPRDIEWPGEGISGLGCYVSPAEASHHGVFCLAGNGRVRRFLQKPSIEVQEQEGAINAYGQTLLDMGVFKFDARTAVRLLELAEVRIHGGSDIAWTGVIGRGVEEFGLDFYREIACMFGSDTTLERGDVAAEVGGSRWGHAELRRIYDAVHDVPCHVHTIKQCEFLHFGTSRQIIESGQQLARSENGYAVQSAALCINSRIESPATISGGSSWVEGCTVSQPLKLAGENLLVGVDIDEPLELPHGACLDLLPGKDRAGRVVTFVRCYGIDDSLGGGRLRGESLEWWAERARSEDDVNSEARLWDLAIPMEKRSLWNVRVFPAEPEAGQFWRWLWCFKPKAATAEQWAEWRAADRYSFEEMAAFADQESFHQRRRRLHVGTMQQALSRWYRHDSGFSSADLAQAIVWSTAPEEWIAAVLREARRREESQSAEAVTEAFSFARTVHTLGSALTLMQVDQGAEAWLQRAGRLLDGENHAWLDRHGIGWNEQTRLADWTERSKALAFDDLRRRIVTSGRVEKRAMRSALRSDEIAWGRAPARLDLAGGWTDTPPYSLENGGTVLNAAVLLNGQPPVQVYGRVTAEPIIRVRSIDLGTHLDIGTWDDLFDYSSAIGAFSLVKAALVISGFTPLSGGAERNRPLRDVLTAFGGGLEITTLAAIPKGSGLGTSSIMGAVLLAVINRMMGRTLPQDELFHNVLRLEQELTTGGGWQDQIGGSIGGLKLVTTKAGMVPEATVRYVPADVLDPRLNGGQTLIYYTGVTRLAKNILQNVVGRYLDRDRETMSALGQLGGLAVRMAEAMGRKDLPQFGRLIDRAWALNQQLDPQSTTPEIEEMLACLRPHIHGAKLLGAGGGGFLLLIAKSPADVITVMRMLDESPPNARARFFDFQVSNAGLAVSVC